MLRTRSHFDPGNDGSGKSAVRAGESGLQITLGHSGRKALTASMRGIEFGVLPFSKDDTDCTVSFSAPIGFQMLDCTGEFALKSTHKYYYARSFRGVKIQSLEPKKISVK
jgi:hypothetical protein